MPGPYPAQFGARDRAGPSWKSQKLTADDLGIHSVTLSNCD
jgi:hypothetical protein